MNGKKAKMIRRQFVTRTNRNVNRLLRLVGSKFYVDGCAPDRTRHKGNEVTPKQINSDGKVRFKNRRRNASRYMVIIGG